MNAIDLMQRLQAHRAWVNHKLLAAAEPLSTEALRKELPIGQGSIWKSLLHLYAAEFVWLGALEGDEDPLTPGDVRGKLPGNQAGEGAIGSLNELRAKWGELDARWTKYLASLSETDLDQTVFKVSSRGGRFGTRCSDILLHVCTHAHYTTAQVINMLRQVGATELPDPMLITLAREGAK
ncbi:MAG: DUF664 domain-containing protein [Planctomycetota bacterium]|nr:MAG: DUF664 domain-containing protein [Planctomycetota bacterium]